MPTPIGYGDMAIEWQKTGDSEPMIITMGMTANLATFSPTEWCNTIFAAWRDNMQAFMPTTLRLVRVTGRFGNDGDDILGVSDLAVVDGSSASDYLPQNCAALVRKVTALGGRRNQGRFFVPYMFSEGAVNDVGVINSTNYSAVQAALRAFLEDVEAPPVTYPASDLVILHRSGTPLTPTPVTDLVLDQRIATQRRRLRR